MTSHVKLLGILYIVYHGLAILFALVVFGILSGIGLLSGDWQATGILGVIAFGILALVTVLALPGIIAGVGLLNRWGWARILALIIGFFSLFEVPLGTALGIYTFWVLLQDDPAVKFGAGDV